MKRRDKGRAVARYLTASTGIPLLTFDGATNRIDGPPPYRFRLVTDAANWRVFQAVRETNDPVIRYDKFVEDVSSAYVVMKLSTFATLLGTHYNSIQDRVQTYIEGE